jgi:hypothetical protein
MGFFFSVSGLLVEANNNLPGVPGGEIWDLSAVDQLWRPIKHTCIYFLFEVYMIGLLSESEVRSRR